MSWTQIVLNMVKLKLKARILTRPFAIVRKRGPCVQILTEPARHCLQIFPLGNIWTHESVTLTSTPVQTLSDIDYKRFSDSLTYQSAAANHTNLWLFIGSTSTSSSLSMPSNVPCGSLWWFCIRIFKFTCELHVISFVYIICTFWYMHMRERERERERERDGTFYCRRNMLENIKKWKFVLVGKFIIPKHTYLAPSFFLASLSPSNLNSYLLSY